jgi:hypothetical protein
MRCHGNPFSRRGFLSAGTLGGLGISLPQLMWMERAAAEQKHYDFIEAKAKSVIHVYLPGGMAHQESWDPKPYSPIEYRGEMKPVKTNTGEIFCESIPKLAGIADRLCVIRSMTHGEAAHERGTHNMFTGYKPSPALKYPSFGAVVSHEYGPRNNLPPYVCIPNQPNEFAGTGYLSSSFGAFSLGSDPASGSFKVRDLALYNGVDEARFARRQSALNAVNKKFSAMTSADSVTAMNTFYERAYNLLGSAEAKQAFDLGKEDQKMKEAYGVNQAGQRLLMARRLVEAGCRLVTLTYGGWDMHQGITAAMNRTMPPLDQALSQLILDLEQRGLLDTTLVMVSSEFGRTPKVNKDAGRDHYPKVFSVMLAGGGIKGGTIYGASNATASEPEFDPVGPEDLATTMYHQLGIVADKELMAPGDRPIEIVDGGNVIKDIVA